MKLLPAGQPSRMATWMVVILGSAVALSRVEYYARHKYGSASASKATASVAAVPREGWLDEPEAESVLGTKLAMHGWALAKDGIARVEVRVDGRAYETLYGITREDVKVARPGLHGREGRRRSASDRPEVVPRTG